VRASARVYVRAEHVYERDSRTDRCSGREQEGDKGGVHVHARARSRIGRPEGFVTAEDGKRSFTSAAHAGDWPGASNLVTEELHSS